MVFSNNEISSEQKEAMDKVSNDTVRNLAPLTLIPLTTFMRFIAYKLKKKVEK